MTISSTRQFCAIENNFKYNFHHILSRRVFLIIVFPYKPTFIFVYKNLFFATLGPT